MKEPSAQKNVEDVYPLSPMQEGMLFHSLYAPGSGVYITQLACTLEGLRVDAFQRAWQAVVDRHSILRTGFVWKNTPRLLQAVGRQVGVPLVQQDWRELTAAEQAEQWAEHMRADRRRDFDFGKAPLLRLSLVRLGEETYRLLWTYHHILLDGWCVSIVLREVFVLYQAFCEGKDERSAGLGVARPFRGYIGWLQAQDSAAAESFWRGVLAGFAVPTPVELGGAPQEAAARPGYGRERLFLEETTSRAAELLARSQNLTLNTLALGSWALFLGCVSGEAEVLFGTVASGRPPELPGVEEIVGPLLNTLPLRVGMDPEQAVLPWLKSIQELQVEMRQYEHTPLADLQKWSGVSGGPAGRALFDSVVAFENYPRPESTLSRLPGLTVRDVEGDEQNNFPLSVSFIPAGGRLVLNVFWERARYERTAIQRMLGQVATLLGRLVESPGLRLGDLSPLSDAERQQVEREWSDTRSARDGVTALGLFEAQAARTPEAVAVVDRVQEVTYRELDERATRLAHHLRRLGAGPESLVGLCLERSVETVEGLLAAWKAGAAYLPLDPSLPAERLAFLLADSGVGLVLTDAAHAPLLGTHGARIVLRDAAAAEIAAESLERLDGGARGGDLAYLIYTSGTTGRPKAVMVEHVSLANVLLACRERFALPAGGAMLHAASFSFDISLFELFAPWLSGGRSILLGRDEILDVPRLAMRVAAVSAFHAVPSLLRQIVDHLRGRAEGSSPLGGGGLEQGGGQEGGAANGHKPSFSSALPAVGAPLLTSPLSQPPPAQGGGTTGGRGPALLFTGGDTVPPDLVADLREVFPASRLAVLYGPTEGTIVGTAWAVPAEGAPARPLIGRPLANVEVRVVDRRLKAVPVGVAGELCLGGAGVARGYLGRTELTRERFVELDASGSRFYRTGDLARWRPDGTLEFLGRSDDQVKIHGFRVELGEIEAVLREHPEVAEAAVLAAETATGRRLMAWVVAHGAAALEAADLRAHLGRKLPAYMVPAAFSFLPALPLTAHGKVDRRALAGLAGEGRSAVAHGFTAPRSADEERLAAIWAEVLKLERVGVHDNFFELGGDSILSIQIVARANRAGIRLTPRHVFEHPTVAELAELAERAARLAPAVPAEQGLVTGAVPLTPVQQRFFALGSPEPHHFNLPLLLSVRADLGPAVLGRAVRRLALHHDALRLRFRRGESGWEQPVAWIEGVEGLPRLVHLDLTALPAERRAPALEAAAAVLQASLDLERGPLLRAAFFSFAPDEPGRLLLAVHHLVVDGVSWRILLEDLEAVCGQLAAGEPVRLPAKTTSFKAWAERLRERAPSMTLAPLASIHPSGGANTMAAARSLVVELDSAETGLLLTEVPAVYRTRINDVLLAALALAWARWSGERALVVNLEGHGREEEAFPGVDLSRTVGWLTSIRPVALDVGELEPGALLKRIKEQLRSQPAPRPGLPEPEIGFNYMGRLDRVLSAGSAFAPAAESPGPAVSRRSVRLHLLEINAGVVEGKLRTVWLFHPAAYPPEAAGRLAAAYQEALRSILAHCLSPAAGGATPSDFPLARLDQETLDLLLGEGPGARDVEDVYPLSPIQEGMLFHGLYAPGSGVYISQLACVLEGLDTSAFRRAWRAVIDRHPILRTAFDWKTSPRLLQVVSRRPGLPLEQEDWRAMTAAEQAERWAGLVRSDRHRDFDFGQAPLLRLFLARTGEETWRLLWTCHHILLDGWCRSLVLREVFTLYGAFRAGRDERAAGLGSPRPYRGYIGWLQQQDRGAAEAFWQGLLQGFATPTPLALGADGAEGAEARPGPGRERLFVDEAATAAAGLLARRQGLTLNTLALGAWALRLSRAGGARDVLFGTVVAGRPPELPGVEEIVGPLLNTLPLRIAVDPGQPVLAWLEAIQDLQVRMRQHEHTPLADLKRWSAVPAGRPLFDSVLAFESFPRPEAALARAPGLAVHDLWSDEQTSFPLSLAWTPVGGRLLIDALYESGERTAVQRLLAHLAHLLAEMVAAPGRTLGELSLLTAAERHQVEVEWSTAAKLLPGRAVPESPQVRVRVLDRDLRPVPVGVAGELWLGGQGVTRGDLRREGLTWEKHAGPEGEKFYRTGDLVRWRRDGALEFLGRAETEVKVWDLAADDLDAEDLEDLRLVVEFEERSEEPRREP